MERNPQKAPKDVQLLNEETNKQTNKERIKSGTVPQTPWTLIGKEWKEKPINK